MKYSKKINRFPAVQLFQSGRTRPGGTLMGGWWAPIDPGRRQI